MEFISIAGEDKPGVIFIPYVYAKINVYERCFSVDDGKVIKVIREEDRNICAKIKRR